MTHRVAHALRAAVGASVQCLTGDEQQLAVHRDVALRPGAHEGLVQPGTLGVGDVPHLHAGEVALNDVGPAERQVGVDVIEIARGAPVDRSEEHTSELQSLAYLVCRLLLEKKKTNYQRTY